MSKLHKQAMDLALPGGGTLGEAAGGDPHIAAKVDRALQRSAHLYSVDYHPDGVVIVRISFDLRDLWQSLAFSR